MIDRDTAIEWAKACGFVEMKHPLGSRFDGRAKNIVALITRAIEHGRKQGLQEAINACEVVNSEHGEHPEMAITCAEAIRSIKEQK